MSADRLNVRHRRKSVVRAPRSQSYRHDGRPATQASINTFASAVPTSSVFALPTETSASESTVKKSQFQEQIAQLIGLKISNDQSRTITAAPGAALVVGAAGTGKSTALALRVAALRHLHDVPYEHICAITSTPIARESMIRRLLSHTTAFQHPISSRVARQHVVRTLQSKALELCEGLLSPSTRIFELLDTPTPNVGVRVTPQSGSGPGRLSEAELAANGLHSNDSQITPSQAAFLEAVFDSCLQRREVFRHTMSELWMDSLTTPSILSDDPEVKEASARVEQISRIDEAFSTRVEQDWTAMGLWPIKGVESVASGAHPRSIAIEGHNFIVNGFIPGTRTLVILGARNRIREELIAADGTGSLTLSRMTWNKSRLFLGLAGQPVLFVNAVSQLKHLAEQLDYVASNADGAGSRFKMLPPGQRTLESVITVLYETGAFAERTGLTPSQIEHVDLPQSEQRARRLARAASLFFDELYQAFDRENLVSFPVLFRRLSSDGDLLNKVSEAKLRTMQHVLVDDYQDIAPLAAHFLDAVRSRVEALITQESSQSFMCFGDDAQAIHATRGATTNFFFDFAWNQRSAALFVLSENFRSSHQIVAAADAMISDVLRGHPQRPRAPVVRQQHKDDGRIMLAEQCESGEAIQLIKRLLRNMSEHETLCVLGSDGRDSVFRTVEKRFSQAQDPRLTIKLVSHATGAEADIVLLLGDASQGPPNGLRNAIYRAASLGTHSTAYDDARSDETRHLAYFAISRAKKLCIWMCDRYTNGNQALLTARDHTLSRTHIRGLLQKIDGFFPERLTSIHGA